MHINEHFMQTAIKYNDTFGASFDDGVSSNGLSAILVSMSFWIAVVSPSGNSSWKCTRLSESRGRKPLFVFFLNFAPERVKRLGPFEVWKKGFYLVLCGLTLNAIDQASVFEDPALMALLPMVFVVYLMVFLGTFLLLLSKQKVRTAMSPFYCSYCRSKDFRKTCYECSS